MLENHEFNKSFKKLGGLKGLKGSGTLVGLVSHLFLVPDRLHGELTTRGPEQTKREPVKFIHVLSSCHLFLYSFLYSFLLGFVGCSMLFQFLRRCFHIALYRSVQVLCRFKCVWYSFVNIGF